MANEKRRLIDANALRLAIRDDAEIVGKHYARIKMHINGAPTVDAVEVVRCKDCKYNDHKKAFRPEGIWCCYWGVDPNPADFCSYGERREGE